jgi:transcriptional regulator with XRE-family HTH domain
VGDDEATDFASIVRRYRVLRGLDIDGLCAAIGGTPGPGFLTSLESGSIGPSSSLVLRLADALALPSDLMLNAAGFTTERQRALALASLAGLATGGRPTVA